MKFHIALYAVIFKFDPRKRLKKLSPVIKKFPKLRKYLPEFSPRSGCRYQSMISQISRGGHWYACSRMQCFLFISDFRCQAHRVYFPSRVFPVCFGLLLQSLFFFFFFLTPFPRRNVSMKPSFVLRNVFLMNWLAAKFMTRVICYFMNSNATPAQLGA